MKTFLFAIKLALMRVCTVMPREFCEEVFRFAVRSSI